MAPALSTMSFVKTVHRKGGKWQWRQGVRRRSGVYRYMVKDESSTAIRGVHEQSASTGEYYPMKIINRTCMSVCSTNEVQSPATV